MEELEEGVEQAARAVREATALLIGAGAGMGVDSGLPDFRGDAGFWRAYPPFAKLGLRFTELANPRWFEDDPELAWGFYGHRLESYRRAVPHRGFEILRGWEQGMAQGAYVFTSNVDGQFQAAGFGEDQVLEVHGSIHRLQCWRECGVGVFTAEGQTVRVDEGTMRASKPLPSCPRCGGLARPNILMFGDWSWDARATTAQEERFKAWCDGVRQRKGGKLVVVECGAGGAIPTVRSTCELISSRFNGTLIRINPREPAVPAGGISLPMGGAEAIGRIAERLG